MTENHCGISPLAALCLQTIRRWWNVVRRGRGGQLDANGTPWTRLPAGELLAQLEREHGISVHVRTVRRALKELADGGHLRREQRYAYRWRRDFWYAPTEQEEALEAHRPSRVAAASMSQREKPPILIERTPLSPQVLSTPVSSSNLKKANQQPNSLNGKKAVGFGRPGAPEMVQKLREAVSRAMGKGMDAPVATEAPKRHQEAGKIWTKIGGYWVVDDLRTAPLR